MLPETEKTLIKTRGTLLLSKSFIHLSILNPVGQVAFPLWMMWDLSLVLQELDIGFLIANCVGIGFLEVPAGWLVMRGGLRGRTGKT